MNPSIEKKIIKAELLFVRLRDLGAFPHFYGMKKLRRKYKKLRRIGEECRKSLDVDLWDYTVITNELCIKHNIT